MDKLDLHLFTGAGGSALVISLVAVIRKAWPKLPSRFIPLLAITLGELLNLGLAYSLGQPLVEAVFLGLVAGLSAVGLYATATRLTPGSKT